MKALDQLNYCHTYADLGSAFGTHTLPSALHEPYLIHVNPSLANKLGIDITRTKRQDLIALLAGQRLVKQWQPIAMKYTGHQFGHYNPDLGDGRGLLLAEILDANNQKWDFHLKGSGQTPYSRQGDGRAVIRSSVREYLISAAMQGLDIPTTQALAILGSATQIQREEQEYAATLLRVSPSHIRFGHFEYLFYSGQHQQLKTLADYVIQWHMPFIDNSPHKYLQLFQEVIRLTATMIAKWHAYGFCHGVMNTDNMSILGLTFDYGPFAFLDAYQPKFICNHSDYSGRYAFEQQPGIGQWNLSALGYALSTLIDKEQIEQALQAYPHQVQSQYRALMRQRFALKSEQSDDRQLINQCLSLMETHGMDFHHTLRTLAETNADHWSTLRYPPSFKLWLNLYQQRLGQDYPDDQQRQQTMQSVNPKYLLRTHLAQQAIEQVESGQFTVLDTWLKVLENPFIEHDCDPSWALPPLPNQKGIGLSCSS
ncbi:protein adenylyltransferase SelO [Vibrio rarus]|uniref:protein adenylyltransferase SelO n=1 Tax=Vibrio rarus TaxID=413403 RepID=UPI0021C41971|nr:YdiU family protein [Vibrio rarus]